MTDYGQVFTADTAADEIDADFATEHWARALGCFRVCHARHEIAVRAGLVQNT